LATTAWRCGILFGTTLLVSVAAGCRNSDEQTPDLASSHVSADDLREPIPLTEAERAIFLAEMRGLLEAVNGVLAGVAANDPEAVASAARAAGLESDTDSETVEERFPASFHALELSMHGDFDRLAKSAEGGAPPAQMIQALSQITGKCVGCHASYRVDPASAFAAR
jgi:cytochrome c556